MMLEASSTYSTASNFGWTTQLTSITFESAEPRIVAGPASIVTVMA